MEIGHGEGNWRIILKLVLGKFWRSKAVLAELEKPFLKQKKSETISALTASTFPSCGLACVQEHNVVKWSRNCWVWESLDDNKSIPDLHPMKVA
jgi:hypothetical protein